MPRYYRRTRRSYKKQRYSNETSIFNIVSHLDANQAPTYPTFNNKIGYSLVPSTTVQGTRKVKNMTLSISASSLATPMVGAVVYVPAGTNCSTIAHPAANGDPASLYEPNQNVIQQFVLNPVEADSLVNTTVQRFRTRLARNLESGDEIRLVLSPLYASDSAYDAKVSGSFNYAIAY